MTYTATLEAHYSKRDRAGNCHWALLYVDHETGKTAFGKVTGGESNINAIRCQGGDWDRSILFRVVEHGIRDFNSMTKNWPHAGCDPADLYAFIQRKLKEEDEVVL